MNILDNIKTVVKTVQKIDNLELYQKILNLQGEIQKLFQENIKLKKENDSLQDKLKIKGSIKLNKGMYWIQKSDDKDDGPFCTKCWDVDKLLVRLVKPGRMGFTCPNCKTFYDTDLI